MIPIPDDLQHLIETRKRANDHYYGPNGIMRYNEPDPKTYSPTIHRIEETYAKYKASEGNKSGPAISQPGDQHEQEADAVAKKVTEDDVNINVDDIMQTEHGDRASLSFSVVHGALADVKIAAG